MTHITCRLTAKNRDQLRNPTLDNRVYGLPLPFTCICRQPTCDWITAATHEPVGFLSRTVLQRVKPEMEIITSYFPNRFAEVAIPCSTAVFSRDSCDYIAQQRTARRGSTIPSQPRRRRRRPADRPRAVLIRPPSRLGLLCTAFNYTTLYGRSLCS